MERTNHVVIGLLTFFFTFLGNGGPGAASIFRSFWIIFFLFSFLSVIYLCLFSPLILFYHFFSFVGCEFVTMHSGGCWLCSILSCHFPSEKKRPILSLRRFGFWRRCRYCCSVCCCCCCCWWGGFSCCSRHQRCSIDQRLWNEFLYLMERIGIEFRLGKLIGNSVLHLTE